MIVSYGGSKTFYLSMKIHGKPQRIKLGKFPEISVEEARKLAIENKNTVNKGKNPNEEKRKLGTEVTLKELFNKFTEQQQVKD